MTAPAKPASALPWLVDNRARIFADATESQLKLKAENRRLKKVLRRIAILAGNGEMGPSKVPEINQFLRELEGK